MTDERPLFIESSANTDTSFAEVLQMISASRQQALQAVNVSLIELYWQVGEYISQKIAQAEWGDGVVKQLAEYLVRTQPSLRGFTRPNLFRMRQFYETYRDDPKVSPLVRQLSWTNNLIILSPSKHPEEREFYKPSYMNSIFRIPLKQIRKSLKQQ